MLKNKVTFKNIDYADLAITVAHMKSAQQRAIITPHVRPKGKSLELLLLATLKPLAMRLSNKLDDSLSMSVTIQLTRSEVLALHAAYEAGWIPQNKAIQTVFEFIDTKI